LAEATDQLGGRINAESSLPGMSSYGRVRDHRSLYLQQAANVDIYFNSPLGPDEILEFGFKHIYLATGAKWQSDGLGRSHRRPIKGLDQMPVFNPDQIMADILPEKISPANGDPSHVAIFDDDHYYMGSVLAEKLIAAGYMVTLITPESEIATWTNNTLEQGHIQKRLLLAGVELERNKVLSHVNAGKLHLSCSYTDRPSELACDALVLITQRTPQDQIYHELKNNPAALEAAGIKTLRRIGDCLAPGIVEAATFSGHQAAREHEIGEDLPFKRERVTLGN
ncbi:MAG: NADH:flavin oxidoreductase, partial [Alphaproteobacteria bacterium]|nr:NADH:flavin oxidoreductase [Alphaproteobacteria bacterium]